MKFFILSIVFLMGCSHHSNSENTISSIHIIDRNGFTETISSEERILRLQKNDYLAPQPYKKVTRTLKKNALGKIPSLLTTYHPNGQLWQYLEVLDGRALGVYHEFFPTGQKRLEAYVIEGEGDLSPSAQDDWIFDGKNLAWNEQGNLIAEISYRKGFLDGLSTYYHANGQIKRTVPYSSGKIEGTISHYDDKGNSVGIESFEKGQLHGITQFQGNGLCPPYREKYLQGKLIEGTYFDLSGQCIAEIRGGNGEKTIFENGTLAKKIEYKNGDPNGRIQLFSPEKILLSEHHIIDGKKHGEEWIYQADHQPKMLISWYNDEIHGTVKTWFANGLMESQREICHNLRHGHSFAWYADGSMMLHENYENGLLSKGSYMKKGGTDPVSTVKNGQGVATLHDADGFFLKKIEYKDGRPVE
ncbi:MAG TPA: hypothetical protein PLO43_01335 [Chlamydiales bacterium]|nr:hypothetical protein [Chlamydiales bacterium]